MGDTRGEDTNVSQYKQLSTLESLLEIEATDVKDALGQASDLLAEALGAEKVDAFLHDRATDSLIAVGTSDTAMGHRQHEIGMNRLPVANGGREVEVYRTGNPYITGHADRDPEALAGYTQGLGVRSELTVPFHVDDERRGVLQAVSTRTEAFDADDLRFLEAASRWVGALAHRAEMAERIARDAAEQGRRLAAEELVTVLAHDFRNHLTPLKAHINIIHRRASRTGDERTFRDAEAASLALERLGKLTSNLLDVGRLEQGLFTLSPQSVDLVPLVRKTVDTLRTPEFEPELRDPEELILDADPDRVRQALENLLSNAQQHSPKGVPVAVEVAEQMRADGRWALLSVRDDGPGIEPELLPRLFNRFQSGPGSNGLGLGLYLARSIADAHGGRLDVESSPGKGTTFRLELPMEG